MRQNQLILVACIYLIAASIVFAADGEYPKAPDAQLTPGVLCTTPDELRYPEKIAYCDRDVSTGLKWAVINRYIKKLNFTINDSNRADFKIDHYIPLCMGGANSIDNLWPQHSSIFKVTDQLEELLCEAMASGKLQQNQAVEKLKTGKANLESVPDIVREINLLLEK